MQSSIEILPNRIRKNETNMVKEQAMNQAAILQQQYMELENDLQKVIVALVLTQLRKLII